eukprot:Gb_06472 [translate_table: standard]
MAGGVSGFVLTPHKTSICSLLQVNASSAFTTSQRQHLASFLMTLTTACDDFLEPSLEELTMQLKASTNEIAEDLVDHLIERLETLKFPDDVFNFFSGLRDLLTRSMNEDNEASNMEEVDKKILNPNSVLGQFVRRCILSFNLLSFEGTCRLVTNLQTYYRCFIKTDSNYSIFEIPSPKKLPEDDEEDNEIEVDDNKSENEDAIFEGQQSEAGSEKRIRKRTSYHLRVSKPFAELGEGSSGSADFLDTDVIQLRRPENGAQDEGFVCRTRGENSEKGLFLRTYGQVDGYLREQADLIEKQVGLFPIDKFEAKLNKLRNLAPELHRVHYLRYLNGLYHGDYPVALDNLHRYFDYSAGKEGLPYSGASTYASTGRFQAVLLSMGIMHSQFGHSAQALEALTEAVQIAQQNNDDPCLAHILAAICYLFSDVGIASNAGIIDSAIPHGVDTGTRSSLAVQQQLPILLKRSLKRAVDSKLTHLVAFNRLALAKFDLKHVRRSPLSFGLKVSTKLRTFPIDVCKELRLSSYALSESGIDPTSMITGSSLSDLSARPLQTSGGSLPMVGDNGLCTSRKHGPISGSILQLAGMSYLLKAASWELYGSGPMVRLNALVHATCYADAASADDLSLAYVKLIQHLAMFKGYKEAFTALNLAEKKFSCVSKSRIQLLKMQLIHDRALHCGEIKLAQLMCNQFGALASPISGVDKDMKAEASLRHARTLLAADQFSEVGLMVFICSATDPRELSKEFNWSLQAASVAQSLFCMCYKFNMQVESTSVLLLLAEIHKKSGNAISGLPYVLASLSLCQSFNLDLLQATAMLTLAELWLNLGVGHAKRALELLYQCLPIILGHGGLELRGRANLAIAKCYLSLPNFSVCAEPETVLDPLRQAAAEFEILAYHELAGEAFYLIAMVFNALGNDDERESSAASFQKHVYAHNNAQKLEPAVFSF